MPCFFYFGVYLVLICLKHQDQNSQISQAYSFSLSLLSPSNLVFGSISWGGEQWSAPWCFLLPFGTKWSTAVSLEAPAVFWRSMGSHCLAEELCFPETIQFIYLSSFAAPMERTLVTLSIFSSSNKITQTCRFKTRTFASPFLLLNALFRLESLLRTPEQSRTKCKYVFIYVLHCMN